MSADSLPRPSQKVRCSIFCLAKSAVYQKLFLHLINKERGLGDALCGKKVKVRWWLMEWWLVVAGGVGGGDGI